MKYPIRTAFPGAANVTQLGYKANSPYDPDPATGGISAQTFDYWSQYYSYYSVLESKCVVTLAQINSSGQPIMWAITQNTLGTGPGTVGDWDKWISSDPRIKQGFLDSGRSKKLVSRWTCKRVGLDRKDNTAFMGPTGTGSNPPDVDYFVMAAGCVNSGTAFAASSPNIYGYIYYKVLLTGLKVVTY